MPEHNVEQPPEGRIPGEQITQEGSMEITDSSGYFELQQIASFKALGYLNELMFHIHCTHCDMGGKHQYKLAPSAYPLVSEIKAWLSEET